MLDIADFQEFAVRRLLVENALPRHLIHEAAHRYLDAAAGDVMFELICIASDVHSRYYARNARTDGTAHELFRACALLAADIHAIGEDTMTGVSCAALVAFWGTDDGYFTAAPA